MVVEEGASAVVVAGVLGRSPRTINDWVKKSKRGRKPSALKSRPAKGSQPKLSPGKRRRLLKLLAQGPEAAGFKSPLWTGPRVAQLIQQEFGVTHHPAYVPTLLRTLGWSPQKPKRRAAERDDAAVERWVAKDWPRIKKRRGG
jgi:transposase